MRKNMDIIQRIPTFYVIKQVKDGIFPVFVVSIQLLHEIELIKIKLYICM